MRNKEEAQMPAPHALLPKLCGNVLLGPEAALLQPEAGQQHFAVAQRLDALAVLGRQGVGVVGAAVFAVQVELVVPELRHQVGHVVGVCAGVVAVGCGGFVWLDG